METIPNKRRFLRLKDVRQRVALSQSRIYDLVVYGIFPKPVKLGASRKEATIDSRTNFWIESEIDHYIDARISERDNAA